MKASDTPIEGDCVLLTKLRHCTESRSARIRLRGLPPDPQTIHLHGTMQLESRYQWGLYLFLNAGGHLFLPLHLLDMVTAAESTVVSNDA